MSSEIIQGIQSQSKLSISKAISLLEKNNDNSKVLLSNLFQYIGYSYRLGITGPPGSGKSSITNCLIKK